jgi:hypothetical protein
MSPSLHTKVLTPGHVQVFHGTEWTNGGPLLGDDPHDLKLAHHGGGKPIYRVRPEEPSTAQLAGRVAYAGPMIRHFGHFVSESVHRIVPARQLFGAERFLFVGRQADANRYADVPGSLRSILTFLDVGEENFVQIKENTEVETLILVQPGSSIGTEAHPQYLDMLRDYSTRRLDDLHQEQLPSKSVYVTGRKGPYGIILGAAYLENFLERAGFWIFRPESHPYSFQLHVYRSARALIFSEGSAVHGASLLGRDMMEDVQVIIRRPETPYIVQRFRADLAGRCRRAELTFCCRYLGSLVRRNKIQVNHLGVSMYNLSAVKQLFYKNKIEKFVSFKPKEYFELCEKELLDYTRFAMAEAINECTPSDLSNFFARFELARRADSIEW